MKNKICKFLFMVVCVYILSGCVMKEEEYLVEKEQMQNYLTNTYGLKIDNGYVYKSRRTTNGVEEGDFIGVFYDERDPSFMIQISMDKDDKKIKDTFDEKTFNARVEIHELLKKYKKDNELNGYLGFSPIGIKGPALTHGSWNVNATLSYSVMKDNIDIENEFRSDYKVIKEVEKIAKEQFDTNLNGVNITYFERNDFQFDKFLNEYKRNYGNDISGDFIVSFGTLNEPSQYITKNVGKPTRVMEYSLYIFEKADTKLVTDTFEQFKEAAISSYNNRYKKIDDMLNDKK